MEIKLNTNDPSFVFNMHEIAQANRNKHRAKPRGFQLHFAGGGFTTKCQVCYYDEDNDNLVYGSLNAQQSISIQRVKAVSVCFD